MKLATYDDGSRDGQLVVVSRDLSMAHFAAGIAGRLQQLLDDWNFIAPQLQDLYQTLNGGNPNLEPEKSKSYETGLRGNFDAGNFDVAVFYNKYRDFIDEDAEKLTTVGAVISYLKEKGFDK